LTAKRGDQLQRDFFTRYSKYSKDFENYEDELVDTAKHVVKLLDAKLPPSGKFKVLLDSKNTGLFAHEAVGHACEADFVLQEGTILQGKLGEQIGSEHVTIVDDPSAFQWGSYKYDDEGVKASATKLIEDGVLKNYMQTRETSEKLDMDVTGNARAQNYNHLPLPRMSNTFFESGKYTFEELLKELKDGYYLVRSGGGGEVAVIEGTFTFSCGRVYEVKNGELGKLLKGVTFSGKILDVLRNVLGVEKKKPKFSFGYCGKNGQRVPVGDGGSHTLVSEMYLGGES
jgi:TldD protein